jgi:predicted Kef-type K+ transport protein
MVCLSIYSGGLLHFMCAFNSWYYLCSIGFHIFPTFIKSEIGTVLIFTILTLTLKFIISFVVIGFFSRQYSWDTFMMSTGLSQISEFTFVLGSRGRRFGVLSREVYLLLLSTTIVSLFFSPLMWKSALAISRKTKPGLLTQLSRKLLWWKK